MSGQREAGRGRPGAPSLGTQRIPQASVGRAVGVLGLCVWGAMHVCLLQAQVGHVTMTGRVRPMAVALRKERMAVGRGAPVQACPSDRPVLCYHACLCCR